MPSLNVRLTICKKISNAILELHRLDLVHKNVNSANVIVLTTSGTTLEAAALLNTSFQDLSIALIDWRYIRPTDAATAQRPERLWWKAIYQHPSRQIAHPDNDYTMGHDVYSLGVCMIEILLWKPLVLYPSSRPGNPVISEVFSQHALSCVHSQVDDQSLQRFLDTEPEIAQIQKTLQDIAEKRIPAAAGQRMAKLVASCLTCLEHGFGELSFKPGTDRLEIGKNFVSAVMTSLSEIVI